MSEFQNIEFDKGSTQVREPLANSYGFDLTDENFIGYINNKIKFIVMGFKPNSQFDTLIATVKVSLYPHIHDEYTHIQKIDLYNNDRLDGYSRTAAFQLKLNIDEVKKGVCSLRERLEKFRQDQLKNGSGKQRQTPVTREEQKEALEILKADNLMDCIEGLLKQAGLVAETENGLRLFLILLSRYFEKPLHVLFQGSPQLTRMVADAVSSTVPPNEIHQQTSMAASTLYYTKNKTYWKNKVLSIGSVDKHFKGAGTIKEFIENQILKRYTTESDYLTRQLHAGLKTVEGNICLLGYSENETMNNKFFQECFFIRIDENEKNKADMLNYLKNESAGLINKQKQNEAKRLLVAIQNLLKSVNVIIPFAQELNVPEQVFQPLRSLPQLLTFIRVVALLHQHQLKSKKDLNGVEYIEATPEHFEIAIELFKSILITQSDILSPSQRNLLERLKNLVKDKVGAFKISDMMKELKIKKTSFYREFDVLKELKYVVQSGGNKKTGIEYKITEWDDYTQLQQGTDILDEQLKKIKSEVSQQIPIGFPKNKKRGKRELTSILNEVSQNPKEN